MYMYVMHVRICVSALGNLHTHDNMTCAQSRGLRATMALNGNIVNSYPRIAEAAREAGW
jgi:hypothetical protein